MAALRRPDAVERPRLHPQEARRWHDPTWARSVLGRRRPRPPDPSSGADREHARLRPGDHGMRAGYGVVAANAHGGRRTRSRLTVTSSPGRPPPRMSIPERCRAPCGRHCPSPTMAVLTRRPLPREEGPMRTLITNGTIVTADGSTAADVLVDGETIAADRARPGGRRRDRRRDHRRDRQVRHPGRHRRPHPHGAAVRRHVRQGHLRDRDARGGVRRHDLDRRLRGPVARASRCARASTPGTPRPRATRSPTTAST